MKGITIIFCCFLFSIQLYSQDTKDIGILVSLEQSPRPMIEYRTPIKEGFKLKLGAYYGEQSNPFSYGGKLVEVSDDSIVERFFYSQSSIGKLMLGMEKQIKSSVFSYGADLLIGYRQSQNSYYNQTKSLTSDGDWEFFSNIGPFNDLNTSRITRHYITPGVRVNMAMNVPVSDRFIFNFFLANTFDFNIHLDDTEVLDPQKEFSSSSDFAESFTSIGFGLRYVLLSKV